MEYTNCSALLGSIRSHRHDRHAFQVTCGYDSRGSHDITRTNSIKMIVYFVTLAARVKERREYIFGPLLAMNQARALMTTTPMTVTTSVTENGR